MTAKAVAETERARTPAPMLRLRPLANALRHRLGARRSLAEAATRIDVLEEESVEPVPPLAILPGMLERVTGVLAVDRLETQLEQARATHATHAAVVRYVLPDCLVHSAGVEYDGGNLRKSASRLGRFPLRTVVEVESALYCNSFVSNMFFGHWLTDACPTALLGDDQCPAIIDIRQDWPDAAMYAEAFSLRSAPKAALRVREMHVVQDNAQGMLKRQRYAKLKEELQRHVGPTAEQGRPVYLKRGNTGAHRAVAGETSLCERLAQHGFEIIDLATTSFHDRIRRLSTAPVVVTISGSHVAHAHFALPLGAGLVTLNPSDAFTMVHRGYANAMGLRFGCVVAEPSPDGYVVSADDLLRTIDLVT